MTELDRAGLDRLLPATPGSPDWADVVSRARAHQSKRRRRLVALAAAALVVAVGAVSASGTVRDFFLDRGFIGLPPQGATPSNPEKGELVLFYWGPVPGDWGKSRFWVYADGRIISLREANRPEGANRFSTGYLEQRLTPRGVELLRSEVISAGLIGGEKGGDADDDVAVGSEPVPRESTKPLEEWRTIEVREGGRLYRVSRVRDLDRLVAHLTDPASWLPAAAWQVREIRAYVAPRYAVCFVGFAEPVDASRLASLLPESVQGLLRGRDFAPGAFGPCTDLTTEESRALREALDAAGLEPFEGSRIAPYVLTYRLEIPGPTRAIVFEPYLPHGEITCSACG